MGKNIRKKSMPKGFSLIEILVVIVITAILAVLLFSELGNVKNSALNTRSLSNLKQAGACLFNYAYDHNSSLPPKSTTVTPTNGPPGTASRWHGDLYSGGYIPNADVFYNPKETVHTFAQWKEKNSQYSANGTAYIFGLQANPIYGLRDVATNASMTNNPHIQLSTLSAPSRFFILVESWSVGAFSSDQPGYFVSYGGSNWYVKFDNAGHTCALFADGHVEQKTRNYFTNEIKSDPSQSSYSGGRGYITWP